MSLHALNKDLLLKLIETIEEEHKKELKEYKEYIAELNCILEDFNIEKCKFCNKYSQEEIVKCVYCNLKCCIQCTETKLLYYDKYSGDSACENCVPDNLLLYKKY